MLSHVHVIYIQKGLRYGSTNIAYLSWGGGVAFYNWELGDKRKKSATAKKPLINIIMMKCLYMFLYLYYFPIFSPPFSLGVNS